MVIRSWFSMGAASPTLHVFSVIGSPITSTDQVCERPTLMVAMRRLSRTSRGLTRKNHRTIKEKNGTASGVTQENKIGKRINNFEV